MSRGQAKVAGWVFVVLAWSVHAGVAAGQGGAAGDDSGRVVMKKVTLHDPGMNGMESHTVLVPEGWRAEGGAFWLSPQAYMYMPSLDAKVIAPDGRMVHLMGSGQAVDYQPAPGLNMAPPQPGSIQNGYPVIPFPRSEAAWAQLIGQIYAEARPGARNIRVANQQIEPVMTRVLRRQLEPTWRMTQQMVQQSRAGGLDIRVEMDAAFLTWDVTYELEGRAYRELLCMALGYSTTSSNAGFGPDVQTFWWVEPAMAFRVPEGESMEEHMPLFLAIANSAQPTPRWAQMKAEHAANMLRGQRRMAQTMLEESRKRSRIISETYEEIGRMSRESYERRSAAMDRQGREFSEYIRGVETYQKPDGEQIQLPNTYEHAYRSANDEYILTNDHNYDPNTDSAVNTHNWEPLRPVE